jgi:subtilisin family serine protease
MRRGIIIMRKSIAGIVTVCLCLIFLSPVSAVNQSHSAAGKLRRNQGAIPNHYIVVLNDEIDQSRIPSVASELAHRHGSAPGFIYSRAVKGFSAQLTEAAALALARSPLVKYVEEDAEVIGASVQSSAPWGLDRIDQRDLPLNSTYNYSNSGQGVNVYVIDSGIRFSHQEFSGRAVPGVDLVADGQEGNDCYGHGTHVAAIIGGNTYGVAKSATLHSVRVLDCFNRGSLSRVVAGVEWLVGNHAKPAVANLSFISTAASETLDTAVRNVIQAGVTFVVSAGNNNIDASTRSPARVAEAITVAATDAADGSAVFSNYGAAVDLFAPGVDIESAWATDDAAASVRSGTSSAAPFVAGVAALVLQSNPALSPEGVGRAIASNAAVDRVAGAGTGTPNLLLDAGSALYPVDPSAGRRLLLDDFESGAAGKWIVYKDAASTLTPTVVSPGRLEGYSMSVEYSVPTWAAISQSYDTPQDWSSYSTLDFWFYGNSTGNQIQIEVSDNQSPGTADDSAERFIYRFVDDVSGWKHFSVPLAAFNRREGWQPEGAPYDGFTLKEIWGFNFAPLGGAGSFQLDQVQLVRDSYGTLDDFESGSAGKWVAYKDATSSMTLGVASPGKVGSYAMKAQYGVGSWAVASLGYGSSKNWSSYSTLDFWFYGGGTGTQFRLELSDNKAPGSNTDTAERFEYKFVDDTAGWKHFSLPWSSFKRRADWQPTSAPNDGLTLTQVWGFNFTPLSGSGSFQIDQVELIRKSYAVVSDFESGTTGGWGVFADPSSTLSTAAVSPGKVGSYAMRGQYSITSWAATYREFATPQDWSGHRAVEFWFYGSGTGNSFRLEISDNRPAGSTYDSSERFEHVFTDSSAGWRYLSIPWTSFSRRANWQPEGAPDDGFTLKEVWEVSLAPLHGTGSFQIDQVRLVR